MKKILIWILVLTLIAVASAVVTIAYFMYAAPLEENTMTVGNASIELVEYQRGAGGTVEQFVNDKLLIPSTIDTDFSGYAVDYENFNASTTTHVDWNSIKAGYKSPIWDSSNINDEIDKMVFVRNTGNTDVYVRVCFAFEAGNYVWLSHFDRMVHLNKNETDWTWSWKNDVVEINGTRYFIAWATYKDVLPAQEYTDISLSQIALDVSAISDHARAFGEKYEVKAFAQGIQAHGFTDATAALTTGFGDTIPFKNIKEVNFVDLPTALHYLNADKKTALTGDSNNENTLVNSITFGLTADHAAKVNGYKGVLTANGKADSSDYTAYTYYVPTADDKYDIYVLADNWEIYTPNDGDSSKRLFADMAGVKKIDTTNLNVSQTRNMREWFNRCKALETIDVSDWDVSNVTDMAYLFSSCNALKSIDVESWDVSNVDDMSYTFAGCKLLTTIGVEDWNVSNVTKMERMFDGCDGLTELDLNSWNTGKLKGMKRIFNGCAHLTTLNISKWDVSNVTNMTLAFASCKSLTSLDISEWDVQSATSMASMFQSCENLTELNLSSWTPSNVTDMSNMFNACKQLTSLDLSKWNTGEVTTMQQMFGSCWNLLSLKLPANVSKVTTMESMFFQCRALTELDLSAWNTNLVTKMGGMFNMGEYVGVLAKIYVGNGWTVANVTSSADMFKNCTSLPGCNGVDNIDASYAKSTAEGGYLTKK